ncbi:MAG: hypothetical protein DME97_02605 [Verrucomicrobia bacterium]|nr:MAG: hypothetical protein DME97_02605 [Verrucomicrobiota bacterium]
MTYWLDLFTGQTWQEFQNHGAKVSGFRKRMHNAVERIKPGDILLCYLTGVKRWVGALTVNGRSKDKSAIWEFDPFPERLNVTPTIVLAPEQGVPMEELEGKVDFYRSARDRPGYNGFLRMSPNRFKRQADAVLLMDLLGRAKEHPTMRPVDAKQLARKPFYKAERKRGRETFTTVVAVPDADETSRVELNQEADKVVFTTRHTEIQHALLTLGQEMGFEVWVARNDRSKTWEGTTLGSLPNMVSVLPTQFNEATNRTIELIDVLWLRGNSIVAAFEVESTTSVYSGLLRMSDLLALQPNLAIDLFLVAPEERKDKVEAELLRPTFKLRDKPLASVCGFLSFEVLTSKLRGIRQLGLATSLKPDFLKKTAEYFGDED